jgi:hypothetical protein
MWGSIGKRDLGILDWRGAWVEKRRGEYSQRSALG